MCAVSSYKFNDHLLGLLRMCMMPRTAPSAMRGVAEGYNEFHACFSKFAGEIFDCDCNVQSQVFRLTLHITLPLFYTVLWTPIKRATPDTCTMRSIQPP